MKNFFHLLTMTEVAKYLRVSSATVRNMIRQGRLKAIKFPGDFERVNYRIPQTEVEKLFENTTT